MKFTTKSPGIEEYFLVFYMQTFGTRYIHKHKLAYNPYYTDLGPELEKKMMKLNMKHIDYYFDRYRQHMDIYGKPRQRPGAEGSMIVRKRIRRRKA